MEILEILHDKNRRTQIELIAFLHSIPSWNNLIISMFLNTVLEIWLKILLHVLKMYEHRVWRTEIWHIFDESDSRVNNNDTFQFLT